MALKQTGKVFPLIVSDVYGVILRDNRLDNEYLDLLKSISKHRKVIVYTSLGGALLAELASHEQLEFVEKFYSTATTGWLKHDPDSYRQLAKAENIVTSDMIFIDDSEQNINASEQAGVTGIVHYSLAETKRAMYDLGVTT